MAHEGYAPQEWDELQAAVRRNCACEFDSATHELTKTCAPCSMLVTDQRALNGLLFLRRKQAACPIFGEYAVKKD